VSIFSAVAFRAVGVLVLTGVYAAWLHVPDVRALLTTPYGHALVAKLGVLTLVLAFAAANRRVAMRGLPSASADPAGGARRFRKWMRAELALAGVLLGTVAWLTSVPPASASAASGPR
jgi:putative copper export protein